MGKIIITAFKEYHVSDVFNIGFFYMLIKK